MFKPSYSVNVTNEIIQVTTSDGSRTVNELLAALEEYFIANPDVIKEVMPRNYDYIMNREKYGTLFTLGSPQMMECGWYVTAHYQDSNAYLKISNFK